MKRSADVCAGLLVMLALMWTAPVSAAAADDDAPRITKEELKAKLNEPEIAVIDVRYSPNWKKVEKRSPGQFVKIRPRSVPGSESTEKTRPLSSTATDRMNRQAPVWRST